VDKAISSTSKLITVVKVTLKEVTFGGLGYRTIREDTGFEYTACHWQDNSEPLDGNADGPEDHKYPISFISTNNMAVSVKWHIEPANFSGTIKVLGDGPDNLDFPERIATISGNDMTITNVVCSNPFAYGARFYNPMSIMWSFSGGGGSRWFNAGTSSNPTCIILSANTQVAVYYRTIVHLGSKNASSNPEESIGNIWNDFHNLDVRRVFDNHKLSYYMLGFDSPTALPDLLNHGDGRCGPWAGLFYAALQTQGILGATIERIVPMPIDGKTKEGIWVKHWDMTPVFATPPGNPIPQDGVKAQGNDKLT
jgi:hypothetical protein